MCVSFVVNGWLVVLCVLCMNMMWCDGVLLVSVWCSIVIIGVMLMLVDMSMVGCGFVILNVKWLCGICVLSVMLVCV